MTGYEREVVALDLIRGKMRSYFELNVDYGLDNVLWCLWSFHYCYIYIDFRASDKKIAYHISFWCERRGLGGVEGGVFIFFRALVKRHDENIGGNFYIYSC